MLLAILGAHSSLAPSGNASGSTIRRRGTRVCLGRRQGAAVPQALLAVDFMRSERHRAEEDAEFGSTTPPLNKDYSAQMSEVRITHPSVVFFFVVRRHRKGTTSGAIRPGRAACKTDEPDYRASVCFTSSHARQECAWIVGVSRFPWHGVVKGAKRNTSRRTTASPARHLLGGTHHEVPCPHGCRHSLKRKEFASPLGVRVCESLHEKQDRKSEIGSLRANGSAPSH